MRATHVDFGANCDIHVCDAIGDTLSLVFWNDCGLALAKVSWTFGEPNFGAKLFHPTMRLKQHEWYCLYAYHAHK